MFVILVHYERPLAEIDTYLAAHRAFLEPLYASGLLLGSGRRTSGTGGVILAKGDEPAALEAIFAGDPFVTNGVARYEFIQFDPNPAPRRSPELEAFLQRTGSPRH